MLRCATTQLMPLPPELSDDDLVTEILSRLKMGRTNVYRLEPNRWWIKPKKKGQDMLAPTRQKGDRDRVGRVLARWLALHHYHSVSWGKEFEARVGSLLERIEGEHAYARRKWNGGQKSTRKLRKKTPPGVSDLYRWASMHIIDVGEGFLSVEVALKAYTSDREIVKTRVAPKKQEAFLSQAVKNMFNRDIQTINGKPGWSGLDLSAEALCTAFGSSPS